MLHLEKLNGIHHARILFFTVQLRHMILIPYGRHKVKGIISAAKASSPSLFTTEPIFYSLEILFIEMQLNAFLW